MFITKKPAHSTGSGGLSVRAFCLFGEKSDQLECTDPARSDFWELAGKCLRLARVRG